MHVPGNHFEQPKYLNGVFCKLGSFVEAAAMHGVPLRAVAVRARASFGGWGVAFVVWCEQFCGCCDGRGRWLQVPVCPHSGKKPL